MSVPVRGSIRLDKEGRWLEEISRRLIALEKASGGTATTGPTFAAPATPAFGSGSSGGSSGGGGGGSSGTTDHGALTGLADNDHPQYLHRDEDPVPTPHQHLPHDVLTLEHVALPRGVPARALPHQHTPHDIPTLEQSFLPRGLPARPLPHTHNPDELQLDTAFYRRGERTPPRTHSHVMRDVADLEPNDAQFILAARIFGG